MALRERDKVLRGMKSEDTPIREGFDIYYNFVRPHQALEGLTPADVAGLSQVHKCLLCFLRKSVALLFTSSMLL